MDINYKYKTPEYNFSLTPTEKTQIVIGHTSRCIKHYLNGIKTRRSIKIPNYTIDKTGQIFNHFTPDNYSFVVPNQNSITIFLENEGWLVKKKKYYYNWVGEKYVGEIYEKEWRGYSEWAKYTDEQISSLNDLIASLTKIYGIPNIVVPNNTKMSDPSKMKGILCRSNYYEEYLDMSPAFDFSLIKN